MDNKIDKKIDSKADMKTINKILQGRKLPRRLVFMPDGKVKSKKK